MTRPKVPDDKRQRTAQACESCKRRKQKCNGQTPCSTCVKRNLTCAYESAASPTKRRQLGSLPSTSSATHDSPAHVPPQPASTDAGPGAGPASALAPVQTPVSVWEGKPPTRLAKIEISEPPPIPQPPLIIPEQRPNPLDRELEVYSRNSTGSGLDEEADVYNEKRMLQDKRGRLLYIGDPAPLSFLQFVRMLIESIAGRSPFTEDQNRHRLMENIVDFPDNFRPLCILPDRQTSNTLIESYFTNTSGFLEVFERKAFVAEVEACYCDPLSAKKSFLCLFYLVLGIGLVLATPMPGSPEEEVIRRLRAADIDRAEAFYRSAKQMCDPVGGFEDADFWSIQALTLMTIYMLAVSKRNAAYAHHGMAVRSAFALGLHRAETSNRYIFTEEQLWLRRTIWRTLFVLDRFLGASLGRPTAISEDDCSGDVLENPGSIGPLGFGGVSDLETVHRGGIDACVRSSHIIGATLRKVYSRTKISTKDAFDLAARDLAMDWTRHLRPGLHWTRLAELSDPAQMMAVLLVNLVQCHSTVLLTRPFFLYVITKCREHYQGDGKRAPRLGSRLEKLAAGCVRASYHSMRLVQKVHQAKSLPRRNPFILHYFFAATLVVLTNEFFALFHDDSYPALIASAIDIMHYCGQTDPQAQRLEYIIETFRDVVSQRRYSTVDQFRPLMDITPISNRHHDPMIGFFLHDYVGNRPGVGGLSEPRFGIPGISRHESRASPIGPGGRAIVDMDVVLPMPLPPVLEHGMPHSSISPEGTTGHAFAPPSIVSNTSAVELSDSMGGDVEFEMESLWHWQGTASSAAAPAAPPGMFTVEFQHQPQVSVAPVARGFGEFTIPPDTRVIPPALPPPGVAPLYSSPPYR